MAYNFNTSPYYDDYNADDRFLRILFQPGRAVQARELTQIQSILQNQLSSGGNHIWKNGQPVAGGQLAIKTRDWMQLSEVDSSWLNRVVYGEDSNAVAVIEQLHDDETQPIYYYRILSGNFNQSENLLTYDTVCNEGFDDTGACIDNSWYDATKEYKAGLITAHGKGMEASVDNGIYWLDNHFVPVLAQTIFIDYTSPTPTVRLGFDIEENIIQSVDDPRLLDPASGFYNQNAPGADRYQITLTLIKEEDSGAANKWQWLADITNGKVTTKYEATKYSMVAKELAQRTYDESGDYTLNPFPLEIKDNEDPSKFTLRVSPSKAYVKGYAHELLQPIDLVGDRARSTRAVTNDRIPTEFGPYFEVQSVDDFRGVFNILNKEYVMFVTDNVYNSGITDPATVGVSKRITHVTQEGTLWRIYLEDDKGLDAVAPAKWIVSTEDPAVYAKLYRPTGAAVKKGTAYPWIWRLTENTSSVNLGTVTYLTQKNFSATLTGGVANVPAGFVDMHWEKVLYIYDETANEIIPKTGTASSGDVWSANLTGNTSAVITIYDAATSTVSTNRSGHQISIMANMYMSNAQWRNTTLSTQTNDYTLSDLNTLNIPHAVTEVLSIIAPDTTDVTDSFTLNRNISDTQYKDGVLTWNSAEESQPGTYTVTYKAYTFGNITTATFFTVNSYTDAGVVYDNIPGYRSDTTKEQYNLSDVLDFRPSDEDYNVGTYLPLPGSSITCTYNYYLSRKDRLVLNTDGEFKIKKGFPSDEPILPNQEENEMTLYTMFIPAYTYNHKNINLKHIKNKRYTMNDIRSIEQRVEGLEYYTALNLLEKETADMQVTDENGLMRYKNGILVDSFVDHGIGDINDEEYFISIYPEAGIATVPFTMTSLDFEGGIVSGLRKNDLTYTLDFSVQEGWIKQLFASEVINLNPYARKSWVGFVSLTPSTDSWFEELYMPDVIIQNENNNAVLQQIEDFGVQTRWNSWQTTWSGWTNVGGRDNVRTGTETTFGGSGYSSAQIQRAFSAGNNIVNPWRGGRLRNRSVWERTATVERWSQDQVKQTKQVRTGTNTFMEANDIRTEVGDRLVDTSAIPWMRSIPVTIKADKLRPNTEMHFRFDDVDVDAYMTPAGGAMGDAVVTDEAGKLRDVTFTIPSEGPDGLRFRTGTKLLTLKDSWDAETFTTQGMAAFTSAGTLHTRQKDILSTLEPVTVVEAITDNRTINSGTRTVNRSRTIATSTRTRTVREWYDPVAESFMVDEEEGGVFIDSIDLYFWSKDDEATPVRLEIRTMENGYPTPQPLPLASCMLYPEDVVTSSNGTANTRFTFPDPIYLMNATEYCFVVISDSLKYNMFVSTLGEVDFVSGEYISSQPYLGSMFTSQNNTTWTAEQNRDVKFQINKCVFDTNDVGTVQLNMKGFDGTKDIISFTPNLEPLVLSGTTAEFEAIINGDTNDTIDGIQDNENVYLESQVTLNGANTIENGYQYTPLSFIATFGSENPNVSPMINTERMTTVIHNSEIYDDNTDTKKQKGVYLTKDVKLANPANDLTMLLSVQQDSNTYVKCFYDTGTVIPRYIDISPYSNIITHGDYTVNDFEEEYAYVYPSGINSPEQTVTNGGQPISGWNGVIGSLPSNSHISTAYVDGDDDPDNLTRMHLADISNMKGITRNCFISRYDLDGVTSDATTAGGDTDLSLYEVGDIWFGTFNNDLDRKFYRKILLEDGTHSKEEVPVLEITSMVPAGHPDIDIELAVIEEDPITWREMKDGGINIDNTSVNTEYEFIEHTFTPLKKVVDEFDHFRVKIELHTINPASMPAVRELRVLALT